MNDLLILESKLAEIGIMRNPSSTQQLANAGHLMADMSASRHLSSALGDSFMVLNHNRQLSRVPSSTFPKTIQQNINSQVPTMKTKNDLSRPYGEYNIPSSKTIIQSNQSTQPSVQPSWGWGLLGFTGLDETAKDILSPNTFEKRKDIKPKVVNKPTPLSDSINWNDQSMMFNGDMNFNAKSTLLQRSHSNENENEYIHAGQTSISEQMQRLQQTIKTLSEENNEMLEKLNTVQLQTEQNRIFKKEIEDFRRVR